METLALALGAALLYLLAYHTYGKWLGQKVFRLGTGGVPPSVAKEDGQDFVPSSKAVVFGHHFTSIAGTGPIVGPALAVIWGWLPALLWVLFGSILIGAVQDLAALVVSMRSGGRTVGDIAGEVLGKRARVFFLMVLFVALTIVLAIFGLVVAVVFRAFPEAILPCLLQIPIAGLIGWRLRQKKISLLPWALFALGLMYVTVLAGDWLIFREMTEYLAGQSLLWWSAVLLAYAGVASVLPVWVLLQPRDFINSLQLLSALGLTVLGLIIAAVMGGAAVEGVRPPLEMVAPAVESELALKQLPVMLPFLFITIACGAVSGFHCLVSSGTSSKQLREEGDAQFVGFGSMLLEGFLAVIVILACCAGLGLGAPELLDGKPVEGGKVLTGEAIWENRYASWTGTAGLPAKVAAFVDGAANFLKALGLSGTFATALMGIFVASFAATTLDTACRLQRYVVQELAATTYFLHPLRGKYAATTFAVILALAMATLPAKAGGQPGTGGMILWPMFGAMNQLLGGMAFVVCLFWMRSRKIPWWFMAFPALFMLVLPVWALLYQVFGESIGAAEGWWARGEWLLVTMALGAVILEIWFLGEAWKRWKRPGTHSC